MEIHHRPNKDLCLIFLLVSMLLFCACEKEQNSDDDENIESDDDTGCPDDGGLTCPQQIGNSKIFIDNTGKIHIIYVMSASSELNYIFGKAGIWDYDSLGISQPEFSYTVDERGRLILATYQITTINLYLYCNEFYSTIDLGYSSGNDVELFFDINVVKYGDDIQFSYADGYGGGRIVYLKPNVNEICHWEYNGYPYGYGTDGANLTVGGLLHSVAFNIDSDGYAHFSYISADDLCYLYYDGNEWQSRYSSHSWNLDDPRRIDFAHGDKTDIILDSSDYVHIAIQDEHRPYRIQYVTNRSGKWKWEEIGGEPVAENRVNPYNNYQVASKNNVFIALDESDNVYIAWNYLSEGAIYLAVRESDGWRVDKVIDVENENGETLLPETDDGSMGIGVGFSMVMDNEDHLHMSYLDPQLTGSECSCSIYGDADLYYITNASGPWEIEKTN